MSVNQRTQTIFFITVTFTLAHLKRTKAPTTKSPTKGPKKWNIDNLTVYETSETPHLKSEIIYVSPAMLAIFD
jgi:hypothetical protein